MNAEQAAPEFERDICQIERFRAWVDTGSAR